MSEQILVQIRFTAETLYGTFSDAIYKTFVEYEALSDAQKDAEKQDRVDAYVATIEQAKANPPAEPTVEELQALKADLQAQLAEQVAAIDAKIVEKGGKLEEAGGAEDAEVTP